MRQKTRDTVKRWGRAALEAVPVVAALNRSSHPVAWLAAALHVWDKVAGLSNKAVTAPESPWGVSWRQNKALVAALVQEGVGQSSGMCGDTPLWVEGGVEYGWRGSSYYGPVLLDGGDPRAPLEALWGKSSAWVLACAVDEGFTLSRDTERADFPPSLRAIKLAQDCLALRENGHHVGVLLDGPPGTGKSVALSHVAKTLGGRVLRASLRDINPVEMAGLVVVLRPDAVILDDIDRGPTDSVLDAMDRLAAQNIAVLATSNDMQKICPALLRTGRIDDHHTFGPIEPDVLAALADKLPGEDLAQFAHLTVSDVVRFIAVRDSLGRDRACDFANVVAEAPSCG